MPYIRKRRELNALEIAVLVRLRDGATHRELAEEFGYSKPGIAAIVARIMGLLDARNGLHAVLIAIRRGYIELGADDD